MSPLRVEDEHGDPAEQRLLDQDDPEPGLARARHADDDAVRGEVARVERDPLGAGLRVDGRPEEHRGRTGHGSV
jgi:hypothetical protein